VFNIKKILCILSLPLLVACQTMQPRIENMPKLDITVNEVGFFELQRQCYTYVPLWMKLLGSVSFGCAIIDFNKNTCTVYVMPNHPAALEHELEHCAGGDHDDQLRKAYDNYLKSKE